MPTGSTPATQISSCAGSSPTICTTITNHNLNAGDVVLVYMIVENTGSKNQLSSINAPSGSARKVGSASLTANTLTFTDLSGTAVNTPNTVLVNSGFIQKVTASTLNLGPRVGMDGTGSPNQIQVSATIADSTLTNITVSGGTATVNYAYPHGISGSGNQIQVRNAASATALNGIQTVTVSSTTAVTFPTSAANGTYTDTNLGVSSRAIDGSPVWTAIKYVANNFTDSTHQQYVYQASAGQAPFLNCAAAAYYWYVDRSQSAMLTFAKACVDNFEDFFPGPEFCGEAGPYCPGASTNLREASADFVRPPVANAAVLYTLLRSQLSSTEKTNFANFFLNDNDTSCVHPSWSQGPGTISVSGQTVTGTSTTFTSSFSVGDYILAWTGSITEVSARVLSITDNTHMTVTNNFSGLSSNVSYWVIPQFAHVSSGTGCGVINFYNHHVDGTPMRDARLYVQPPPTGSIEGMGLGYLPPAGSWLVSQGNNQTTTATLATMSMASALAEDDSRALSLLQGMNAWTWGYLASDIIGTWGGLVDAGPYYGLGRTVIFDFTTNLVGQRSVASFPNVFAAPHNNAAKQQSYFYLYSWMPSSAANDPFFLPWSYGPGELSLSEQYSSLAALSAMAGADGQYMSYLLAHYATNWGSGSQFYESPILMPMVDPNAGSSSFTSLPLQYAAAFPDSASCPSLGITCGLFVPNFVQAEMLKGGIVSRTGWTTATSTVFAQTSLGGANDVTSNPMDHGATIPGNYHIIKESSSGMAGCLVGDNDNNCSFFNGINYGDGELSDTTVLAAGTSLKASNGTVNAIYGPVLKRWSGATVFGDSSSRYVANTWELQDFYLQSQNVTRAQRSSVHFKKSGTDEFILIYDDVAKSGGAKIAGYTQYPQGAPTGCCTGGTTTFSGGLLTTTNTDGYRVLGRWLSPAGSTALAVINDGTGYSTHGGDTDAYRLTHCSSTDGSTCSTSATSMEAIQAQYVTTSGTSTFTAALLSPDSNWTGAQVTGASSTKVAFWARQGGAPAAMTSIALSYSGTAQILISGLTPGNYPVQMNGSAVSGSPFTVVAGDNSIYFESTSGTLSIGSTTPTATVFKGNVKTAGSVVVH